MTERLDSENKRKKREASFLIIKRKKTPRVTISLTAASYSGLFSTFDCGGASEPARGLTRKLRGRRRRLSRPSPRRSADSGDSRTRSRPGARPAYSSCLNNYPSIGSEKPRAAAVAARRSLEGSPRRRGSGGLRGYWLARVSRRRVKKNGRPEAGAPALLGAWQVPGPTRNTSPAPARSCCWFLTR